MSDLRFVCVGQLAHTYTDDISYHSLASDQRSYVRDSQWGEIFFGENYNFLKRFLIMLQNKRDIPLASQFNELLVENISQPANRKTPASPSSFSLCPLELQGVPHLRENH